MRKEVGVDLPPNKIHLAESLIKGINQIMSALVPGQDLNHAPLRSCS
jgi:hypothetical protein